MPNPHDVFEHLDREPNAPRMSDLWEWARCDYFAGESADVVCERHKLSRSQFFERAKREGWLRRDQPRTSAEPVYDAEAEAAFVEDALDRPPPSAYSLYRRAWARVERAVSMGRRVEAAGWTRLAKELRKLALQEHAAIDWRIVVKAEHATPDFPDSPPLRSGGGGREADGGGSAGERSPVSSEPAPDLIRGHGAEKAPRHLPRCAGEESTPDSPDSLQPTAHPRGSGDPGLSRAPIASEKGGSVTTSPHAELLPKSLGPRVRGDERKLKEEGSVKEPDSPDSKSQQALSRLAFKLSRRAKRRLRGRG